MIDRTSIEFKQDCIRTLQTTESRLLVKNRLQIDRYVTDNLPHFFIECVAVKWLLKMW